MGDETTLLSRSLALPRNALGEALPPIRAAEPLGSHDRVEPCHEGGRNVIRGFVAVLVGNALRNLVG